METVFITGIAGTLGKAFARFLLSEGYQVWGCDTSEWAVAELKDVNIILGDFVDVVDSTHRFDYLIHCAAYKHVNLGEENVAAFIGNNLEKLVKLYAHFANSKKLFISSDKAVEPISNYGYTKALGEALTREYHGSVARLGNIKGSTGSVIPIWEVAVANNEPLPITDPLMSRYLIDVDDAVAQIWPRFLDGEVLIVPEMGEPQQLGDIVEELYPGYPTEIIGIRKGEKMHEKLRWDWE